MNFIFEGGYAPSRSVSLFLEYFSGFYKGGSQHHVDAGILYAVTSRFQVDLATGVALNDTETPCFGTIGISYFLD